MTDLPKFGDVVSLYVQTNNGEFPDAPLVGLNLGRGESIFEGFTTIWDPRLVPTGATDALRAKLDDMVPPESDRSEAQKRSGFWLLYRDGHYVSPFTGATVKYSDVTTALQVLELVQT